MTGDAVVPKCRVCGADLPPEDAVYCGRCGTPHHRDCWSWVGRCAIFACGSTRSVASPDRVGLVAVGTGQGRVRLAGKGGALVAPLDVDGNEFDTAAARTRLDLDTPLELALQYGALGLLGGAAAFAWPKHGAPHWGYCQAALLSGLVLLSVRLFVDCTYVLDNERRTILFARAVFGFERVYEVCSFDDVVEVGLTAGLFREFPVAAWNYAVVVVLPKNVRVQVSGWTKDYARAAGFAGELAEHLGALFVQPEREVATVGGERGAMPATVFGGGVEMPSAGRTKPWVVALFVAYVVLNLGFILWGP